MSIVDRIMKLFQVEIPLNKTNVECALRKTVGEDHFNEALRHLIRAEEKIVLEQYDKDELVEMLLDVNCPPDGDVSVDEFFESYVKFSMESIGEFIEYLDNKLPKDLI